MYDVNGLTYKDKALLGIAFDFPIVLPECQFHVCFFFPFVFIIVLQSWQVSVSNNINKSWASFSHEIVV